MTFVASAVNQQQVQPLTQVYVKVFVVAALLGALVIGRQGRRLWSASIVCTAATVIFIGVLLIARFNAHQSSEKLANSLRTFATTAQRSIDQGTFRNIPTAPLTGDADNDVVIRCLNDLAQRFYPVVEETNKELTMLETDDNAFNQSLSAETLRANAQREAWKRTKALGVIASARIKVRQTFDEFIQTAATRYASTGRS